RQRLRLHAVGGLLDRVLPGHRLAAGDRRHQPGGRSSGRGDEPAARTVIAMAAQVVAVENLKTHLFTRSGGVKAGDGVSFTVAEGEVLGLVGESGSGKTVTGWSILGLVDPPGRIVDGSIRLAGEELVGCPEEKLRAHRGRDVAMIFQDPMMTLNPVL